MLSLTSQTHAHSRGARDQGQRVLHWAEKAYTTRQSRKERVLQQYTVPEKNERETQKEPNYQRKKLEHLPKDHIRRSKV
jgi:hypothetical protein